MTDRPFDCSECRRNIAVHYREIVGDEISQCVMCSECPHLQRKLYGKRVTDTKEKHVTDGTSLVCGHCGTTLEVIRKGERLGCIDCYDLFADQLIDELLSAKKISRHLTSNKKTMPLHIGRIPGEISEINPTLKLIALNEALDETLVREDYETAALLRDQIRALKEKGQKSHE